MSWNNFCFVSEWHSSEYYRGHSSKSVGSCGLLRKSLATRLPSNSLAHILWSWNPRCHCEPPMVYHRLLGGRKGVWNNFPGIRLYYDDCMDSCMDSLGRSVWKAQGSNWKKPIRVSKTINETSCNPRWEINSAKYISHQKTKLPTIV